MNTLSTIMASFALLLGSILTQDTLEVPNAVKNAFSQNFNNSAGADWKKISNGYEVDFDLGTVAHAARYTADGELLMVKMEMNEQDLPTVILQRIIDDFRQFEITDIDQIKVADRLLIQVALRGPSEDRKVVFTPDGKTDSTFPYWN